MIHLFRQTRPRMVVWVWLFLLFYSTAVADSGDGLSLLLGSPFCRGKEVVVEVSVDGLFGPDVGKALSSGLPATLVYEWELWRNRSSWWDSRIEEGLTTYRILFDLLEESYDVFNDSGKPIGSCKSLQEVDLIVCQEQELELSVSESLSADKLYYIGLEVRLEFLDKDELEKMETWLRGESSRREGKDLLTEITRQATDVIRRVTGRGVCAVSQRSDLFMGCH